MRLYVPRVVTSFQEAKALVVLPFIKPPREKTMGVEREIAGWAVPELVVGNRVEILVDQPGWVAVLIREAHGAGILACKGDNREVVLGIG
jgi:hypothetical protein